MNEVTRPTWPRRTILSAAATVAALALALFLISASAARGASEPVTDGSTLLTLKKGFINKLGGDVKLRKRGSATASKRTVQLPVTGGSIDSAAGTGRFRHGGGFTLKLGKASVGITRVEIDLTGNAVFANVGKSRMKLGTLPGVSLSPSGRVVFVNLSRLKLTNGAAKAINGKLGVDAGPKGGDVMGLIQGSVRVTQNVPAGQHPPAKPIDVEIPVPNRVAGVMTRNLYLGADLGPGIGAPNLKAFVAANGQILREVTHNDFPTRSEGLADEILEQGPDLVGLQEVALWRTQPVNFEVLAKGPSATTVRYDYLQELLDELNTGGERYHVVVVQNEFDLEAPADEDGNFATGPEGADINGRLTMRDVILAKSGAGVETWGATGDNFETLLTVPILTSSLQIKRGWTSTEASVRGGRQFRFVNTHLEAFHPLIRAAQAAELVEPLGGPLATGLTAVLVGDLNSDDNTTPGPGDPFAYGVLTGAGLVERSTDKPMSCCLDDSELGEFDGGQESDFDHQVDHIMTNDPERVLLLSSAVTGRSPVNGFWDSDHAGLFSSLEILP